MPHLNINILGHIFYLFIFIGMVMISRKKILGWPLRFIGEIGWIFIGLYMNMSSIWFWGIAFAIVDMYGMYRWSEDKIQLAKAIRSQGPELKFTREVLERLRDL